MNRYHIQGAIVGVIASLICFPLLVLGARTAVPIISSLFPTALTVAMPAPIISLGNSTTTGSVYSNGGNTLYFQVTALDGQGETIGSQLLGTSTADQAHGWNITWSTITGAVGYRVYFSTSTPQSLTQYFSATSTGGIVNRYYTFTSTSSPVFSSGPPSTTGAYPVNLQTTSNSWLLGGNFGISTTSPITKFDVASGTMRAYSVSTTTCAASNDGAIFYHATDKHLYVCEASTWQIIK